MLLVGLIVNHLKYLLRALADTGVNSIITFETHTSKYLIRNDERNETTWNASNLWV
jgi:hypothetical protein